MPFQSSSPAIAARATVSPPTSQGIVCRDLCFRLRGRRPRAEGLGVLCTRLSRSNPSAESGVWLARAGGVFSAGIRGRTGGTALMGAAVGSFFRGPGVDAIFASPSHGGNRSNAALASMSRARLVSGGALGRQRLGKDRSQCLSESNKTILPRSWFKFSRIFSMGSRAAASFSGSARGVGPPQNCRSPPFHESAASLN